MHSTERVIRIVTDADALTSEAAETLIHRIHDTLEVKEHFTLVLSGGSTPGNLFALLAEDRNFRSKIPWDRIHFFWGDERHVPPDHTDSNYRMAEQALLSRVPVPADHIHRIKAEESKAGKAAEDYEQELRAFFSLKTGQLPRFDHVLLGMGPDGHTASLFPMTEALHEQKRLVVANWVEKFRTYRITMTSPVLNNADFINFLVSGDGKAEALRSVLEGDKQPDRFPAQLIEPTQGKLLWLADRPAARLLTLKG